MAVRPVIPTKPTEITGGWRNVLLGGRKLTSSNPFWKYNARYAIDRHTGVDFSAGTGTPVNIPLSGTVVEAGWGGAYGNTILVKLNNGDYMRFAHLSKISVSKGQTLKAGNYIGAVGNTGTSTGPHLHLEVLKASSGGKFGKNSFLDPVAYLNGIKTGVVRDAPTTRGESAGSDVGKVPGATTVNVGTTSGGFGNVAGFTKKDFYALLSANFGSIDTLLQMDKEARAEVGGQSIKWAVDQIVKKKIVDPTIMKTYLEKTGWFKKYGEQTTERLIDERSRPGFFADNVANVYSSLEESLRGEGVTISDSALQQIARNAYVYGWDGARMQQAVRESGALNFDGRKSSLASKFASIGFQLSDAAMDRLASTSWIYGWTDESLIDEVQALGDADITWTGGAIAQGVEDLTTFADDYGVKLTESDVRQYRNDFLDNLGDQNIRDVLQQRAAQTYSIWADEILAGRSTKSLAGAYFSRAGDLLEVDPNSINWDDPLFTGGRAFMTVDPNTGKQVQKGLWDFEKEIRHDSRWMTTKNARDSMVETTGNLLSTMGLI